MTKAETTRAEILRIINDESQMDLIKRKTSKNIRFFEKINKNINHNNKMKLFIRWVIEQSKSNFYLSPHDKEINKVFLLNRNKKSVLVIGYVTPLDKFRYLFKGHNFILEIIHIHSLEKGEGYSMMKKVIELSEKINSPISLYTETEENVQYFERYGFVNIGRVGDNNEFLMVLNTKQIEE